MSALDGGLSYGPAPGPRPGTEYMFTTLRAHLQGGYIPPHFDDEQAARPSYRLLLPLIPPSLFSFVLAFSQAQEGGALELSISTRSSRASRSRSATAARPGPISPRSSGCRFACRRAT